VNAAALGRFAGFQMNFANLAALNAAVQDERLNIGDGSPLWSVGQVFSVGGEPVGVVRTWTNTGVAATSHARNVTLRAGLTVTVASDGNNVLATAGAPSTLVGSNGDIAVDFAANSYYTKSSNAWSLTSNAVFPGSGSGGSTTVVNDLVTGGATSALSAEQGKVLKAAADTLATAVNGKAASVHSHAQYAPSASPDLTGTPTAPTAAPGVNSSQLATTAFVQAAVAAVGGAPADTAVTNGSTNAVSGNAVFTALAAKANKAGETLTSTTLAGATALSGVLTVVPSNMPANEIDVGKSDQKKTISNASSGSVPLTYSGTPPVGTVFGYELNNTDSVTRTVTIPSTYSRQLQKLITSFDLPPNGIAEIQVKFDGTAYRMWGDPVPLSPKIISWGWPSGADDTTDVVIEAPHAGTITKIVTKSKGGSATYKVQINGVDVSAATNPVSTTKVTQTTTATNRRFVAGDIISVVRTANASCDRGTIQIHYAPDAP
jgi:hypothetical protein